MGMPRLGAGRTADEIERDRESNRPPLRHRQLFFRLTAAWVASGVILYLCVPLISPALLLLSPVAPMAWYVATARRLPRSRPSTVTFALLLAGAYLAWNSSWSMSPDSAHLAIVLFFLFVLAAHLTGAGEYDCVPEPLPTLRHSCAMMLLHAGVDLTVIALWLGHESTETTQIYLHADMAIKERALARAAPPDSTPGRYKAPDTLLAFLAGL